MYHLGVVPVVPLLADGTSIHYSGQLVQQSLSASNAKKTKQRI